jgi:predicted aspartyl protease
MRYRLTTYIALAMVSVAASVEGPAHREGSTRPRAASPCPMKSFGGRPVVDVTINGDAHSMVLDTGATRTVIDPGATGRRDRTWRRQGARESAR